MTKQSYDSGLFFCVCLSVCFERLARSMSNHRLLNPHFISALQLNLHMQLWRQLHACDGGCAQAELSRAGISKSRILAKIHM